MDAADDLDPLLQALVLGARHDKSMEKWEKLAQELDERDQKRLLEERIANEKVSLHCQPTTTTYSFSSDKVRLSDMRISDRIGLSSVLLRMNTVLYNDINNEIGANDVKQLDSNLYLSEQMTETFEKITKNMDKEYLLMDTGPDYNEPADSLDMSALDIGAPYIKRLINRSNASSPATTATATNNNTKQLAPATARNLAMTTNIATATNMAAATTRNHNTKQRAPTIKTNAATTTNITTATNAATTTNAATSTTGIAAIRESLKSSPQSVRVERADVISSAGYYKSLDKKVKGTPEFEESLSFIDDSRRSDAAIPDHSSSDQVSTSNLTRTVSRRSASSARSERLAGEHHSNGQKPLSVQDRLNNIWRLLHMSDDHKRNMIIKYSSDKNYHLLEKTLSDWETAAGLIARRESFLIQLEKFEELASDTRRFFDRNTTSEALLNESRTRGAINKKLSSVEVVLRPLLERMERESGEFVTYQGRRYLEKMSRDKTEMLYWLQEMRKISALERSIKSVQ